MDILNISGQYILALPVITGVVDSQGTSIPNNGTTEDTGLTLSGTATANAVVIILDNATPIGSASVTTNGTWEKSVTVALGIHSFTVQATDGTVSQPWVITVQTAALKPVITRVADSKDVLIPEGGVTFDNSATVSGTAQSGSNVEIEDGSASWGTAPATGGNWTKVLSGLTVKAYSITAKGLYGNGPVSDAWGFAVTAATAPTITSVRDSKGEVANGGSTVDTSVTLSGKAAASEYVEIFDGETSKGRAGVNGNGDWTHSLTGLNLGSHSIKAIGLYGSNPESTLWAFTVTEVEVKPVIAGVRGPGGSVGNGGTTTDTNLTLNGTATKNSTVEILEGGVRKGTATVDGNGNWTTVAIVFPLGAHSLTARMVGGTLVSDSWAFTVQAPLSIDTSPVTLSGRAYIWNTGTGLPAVPAAGTSIQRSATGGTPAYTYRSSGAAVSVNAATGLVRALRNGSATITVRDASGTEKSYQVTVTDAWIIEYIGNFIHNGALQYQRPGGHLPTGDELQQIRIHYGASWPHGEQAWWSADVRGVDALAVNIPSGGAFYTLRAFAYASLSVYR